MARNASAAATPNTLGLWTSEEDNYRLWFASYDDNGNLKTLRRRGLLANATHATARQFGAVDNLTYAYAGNRLLAVDDLVSTNQLPRPLGYEGAPTSLAGDFQEGGMHQTTEYDYDANGSLTQDRNKGISGIAYNHLNLPQLIHFGIGADSIVFRYTAAGQKVAKLVYQHGKPLLRTDYLSGFQYEGDSLRFFPHAEGRVLRSVSTDAAGQATTRYAREFSFKDHLGNLRLAYRAGQHRRDSVSLEPAAHARESQQFDSLSVSAPVAQNVGSGLARSGSYAARLNAGGTTPQPLGPLKQLAVQKGDTVTVTAYGFYAQPVRNNFWFSLASFLTGILQPAAGTTTGTDPARGRAGLPLLQVGVATGLASLPQLSNGVPKGYLRLLVFNADSVLVSQQTQQLTSAALNNYQPLRLSLLVPQDGYVTTYVGNESDVDVLFDDVTVVHGQGLQVQENQYDPFGLDLAGVSSAAPGLRLKNFYQFNGKENQLDLGLNWNHQDWRFLDNQLLRWHSVDRKPDTESQESWSTYQFGLDNPVRYNDPDGECPPCIIAAILGILSVAMPANAPGLDPVANKRQMATAKAEYDNGMLGALMPAGKLRTGWSAINGARNVADRLEKSAENKATPTGSSPPAPGRKGAFNAAKRDAGVPRNQQPDMVTNPETGRTTQYSKKNMTVGEGGKPVLDKNGMPVSTREYQYTIPQEGGGQRQVIIQDHGAGHSFGEGGIGDQSGHFNVRPPDNTRTGKVSGTKPHYPF